MNKVVIAVLAGSAVIISTSVNALEIFDGAVLSDNWQPSASSMQPSASSSQPTTYKSRGAGKYTGNDGSILRSRSNNRLVDIYSGATYRDRGNGRLTGSNGSTCRDRGNGSIGCY
jgi:hypothetical protein